MKITKEQLKQKLQTVGLKRGAFYGWNREGTKVTHICVRRREENPAWGWSREEIDWTWLLDMKVDSELRHQLETDETLWDGIVLLESESTIWFMLEVADVCDLSKGL